MHDHTKQILDEFKKNFKDFAFNSKTHFGRMADSSAILNFCEKEVHQALLSQAEYIRAEMVPKEDEYKDRVQNALGAGENVGFNQCRLIVKWKLDRLINSFK